MYMYITNKPACITYNLREEIIYFMLITVSKSVKGKQENNKNTSNS